MLVRPEIKSLKDLEGDMCTRVSALMSTCVSGHMPIHNPTHTHTCPHTCIHTGKTIATPFGSTLHYQILFFLRLSSLIDKACPDHLDTCKPQPSSPHPSHPIPSHHIPAHPSPAPSYSHALFQCVPVQRSACLPAYMYARTHAYALIRVHLHAHILASS